MDGRVAGASTACGDRFTDRRLLIHSPRLLHVMLTTHMYCFQARVSFFLVEMLNSSTFLVSFYCFVGQQAIKPPRCTGAAVTALPSGRLTPRVCVAAVCGGVCTDACCVPTAHVGFAFPICLIVSFCYLLRTKYQTIVNILGFRTLTIVSKKKTKFLI